MNNRREFSKKLFCVAGCCLLPSVVAFSATNSLANTSNNYNFSRISVYNRGRPPIDFLDTLVHWGKNAPDEIFDVNNEYDVYSHVKYKLGPWKSLRHRKAAMLEVLRVLGGFESSWDWNAGIDLGKSETNTPCTEEAGLFQCSGNSLNNHVSLRDYFRSVTDATDCITFIKTTKEKNNFAIEYCARLLRFTVTHHGPLKRKENDPNNPRRSSILPYLSRDAVEEFEVLLS